MDSAQADNPPDCDFDHSQFSLFETGHDVYQRSGKDIQ